MSYYEAKQLKPGDRVVELGKEGEAVFIVTEVQIDQESQDAFVRCEGGKLFHHTSLTLFVDG